MSPAGFYAWLRRPPSARGRQDAHLRVVVATRHRRSKWTYGAPRIQADLQGGGERVARKRVARLVREQGPAGTPPRRFRVTTGSGRAQAVAPNHLDREFKVAAPNRVWATDLVPEKWHAVK